MYRKASQQSASKLNLLALRRHYTDPHPFYDALRAQQSLYFDASSQSWLATGHGVITSILDDPRFLSSLGSAAGATSSQLSPVSRQMLFMDGEKHRSAQSTMLRPLAQMVKSLPSVIRKIAHQALQDAREQGEIEIVSQFASPISLLTIAHVLGIPCEDKELLQQLEQWSDTFGDITSGYFRGNMQEVQQLEDYFRSLIAQKRHHPSDDLLSSFIQAHDIFPEEDDLVANCMMVFAAGRITTKKLLSNGCTFLLSDWSRTQTALRAEPRLARALGEELLRIVTPTRYLMREASEDIPVATPTGTQLIPKGQRVLLFLEAADYDPAVFHDPALFQPHRRPNKHIAFGYGPHQCPGATLARVEIQQALEELFSLASVCAKPGVAPTWNPNPNLGGFTSNVLVFHSKESSS